MAEGIATNNSDKWQDYALSDWEYADFLTPEGKGTRKPVYDEELDLPQMYKNYSVNRFPADDSNDLSWIVFINGVHEDVDEHYYLLDWDQGEGEWGVTSHSELNINPLPGTGLFIVNIEPNGVDVGWNNTSFVNIALPGSFTFNGGTMHIDWFDTTGGSTDRQVHTLPWVTSNAFTYTRYDILAHPISIKWKTAVRFDFNNWVCIKNHTHNPAVPGPTTPGFGSIYWQQVETGVS